MSKLDLERGAVEVEVPAQEVVGGLAEILRVIHGRSVYRWKATNTAHFMKTNLPGWGNGLREGHFGVEREERGRLAGEAEGRLDVSTFQKR